MRYAPRRLRSSARRPLAGQYALADSADIEVLLGRRNRVLLRGSIRAMRRLILLFGWTLLAMPVQGLCLLLPGRPKVVFARFYWAMFCRLIGMHVRVVGAHAGRARSVMFVSNHSSWLDVPVLGGHLDGCFVSKGEVGSWPLIGMVARLGRTLFVSRQRGSTRRERDAMRARLATGDNLILFPEGTTSDGSRVMPFRTAFFAAAEGPGAPMIQPVSVVYDRLAGLPTGRATRPLFAWYGDMDIASHYWRLARHRGLRATVLLHAPLDPSGFADRKALSQAVWRIVAGGAATLRQNRQPQPLGGGTGPASAPASGGRTAYA